MPFQAAFKAPFNVVSNARQIAKAAIEGNEKAEKLPPQKIVVSFTPDDAMAAAQYLIAMANKAQQEGTTFKTWDAEQRVEVEVPGFAMWGSVYGNRGEFSPAMPEGAAPAPAAVPQTYAAPVPAAAGATWG